VCRNDPHALNRPINCHFCHQPIAFEELAEGAALPAHKKCIR
jgi:hypothetical protein